MWTCKWLDGELRSLKEWRTQYLPSVAEMREKLRYVEHSLFFPPERHPNPRLISILLVFAMTNDEWHSVPWRMLRNAYMNYGVWRCYRLRDQKEFEFVHGDRLLTAYASPDLEMARVADLYRDLEELIDCGFCSFHSMEDEKCFYPTDALFDFMTTRPKKK